MGNLFRAAPLHYLPGRVTAEAMKCKQKENSHREFIRGSDDPMTFYRQQKRRQSEAVRIKLNAVSVAQIRKNGYASALSTVFRSCTREVVHVFSAACSAAHEFRLGLTAIHHTRTHLTGLIHTKPNPPQTPTNLNSHAS